MDQDILDYYSSGIELSRLDMDVFLLEKLRSMEVISRYLQPAPMKILDVGGGAGVYAFWLKELGHEVHLIDPSPVNVEAAGKGSVNMQLDSITRGEAQQLPFADESFDLVLMLGPLYHITEKEDRIKALKEVRRVLKKKSILIAAAISRYASLFDGFSRGLVEDPAFVSLMRQDLLDGQHRNNTGNSEYFTTAFFHHPLELKDEIINSGLEVKGLLPVESFGWLIPDVAQKATDPSYRKLLLDTIRTVEDDPYLLGISAHLLAIAIK